MSFPKPPPRPAGAPHLGGAERERSALIRHVLKVQDAVRPCTDCGLCCTDLTNSMRILPVEALRTANHLAGWSSERRQALVERLRRTVERYDLKPTGTPRKYTCSFLEQDLTCALPFEVKPVGCLAFNPVHVDACDMDEARFEAAHGPVAQENQDAGWVRRRVPIPLAVLAALDGKTPRESRPTQAISQPGGRSARKRRPE